MIRPSLENRGLPLAPPARLPLAGLRPILFGPEVCQDLSKALAKEWVVTNGLGGYAASTITGLNTRATHGLLVAATHPPVGRWVLLSTVEETVVTPSGRFELSVHQHAGMMHPEGYRYLAQFRLDPWPTFIYRIGEILLSKSLFLLPGENALVVGYTLLAAAGPIEMTLRPLVAFRPLGSLRRQGGSPPFSVELPSDRVIIQMEGAPVPLVLQHTAEMFEKSACWLNRLEYGQERALARRRPAQEDLWSPGILRYLLKVGESYTLVASTGRRGGADWTFHERRMENTDAVSAQNMRMPGPGPLTARLGWAGQRFVARSVPQESAPTFLIAGLPPAAGGRAGLPELTASGREALLALPGLALSTRRFDLARSLLEALSAHLKAGLIPVRLQEESGSPAYDSADSSLWFCVAAWRYWSATRDLEFISKRLMDPLREIVEGYLEGTSFGIGMDEDGLIELPDQEIALTWMDAYLPGRPAAGGSARRREIQPGRIPKPVTPRSGKPVEVNGLWYCTLRIMAAFSERLGLQQAKTYNRLTRLVGQNFLSTFLSPEGGLYDRVTRQGPDPTVRPNMLIVTSLPFTPLSAAQAAKVLAIVEKELLTPWGVRTLSPRHPQYRGRCEGIRRAQALATHQGTLWSWLIGPYVRSVLRVRRLTRATQAALQKRLRPLLVQCQEQGLGGIAEMRDGDPPHQRRGALNHAAASGELLSAIEAAHLGHL